MGNISKEKREQVYRKYNGHCAYCGRPIKKDEMQIDHLVPKARKGTNDITNLMPSCPSCNSLKADKSLRSFRKVFLKGFEEDWLSLQDKPTFKALLQQEPKLAALVHNRLITFSDKSFQFYFQKPKKDRK